MSGHWLRHRRLGRQVAAVLALPVSLAVALGVLQIRDAADALDRRATTERHALLSVAAASLARDLQNERDALSVASGRADADVTERRRLTDAALADFRTAAGHSQGEPGVEGRLAQARDALERLTAARAGDMAGRTALLPSIEAYTGIVTALDALVPSGDPGARATNASWAPYALAAGTAALSGQRALINSPVAKGRFTKDEVSFLAQQEGLRRFMAQEYAAAARQSGGSAPEDGVGAACLAEPLGKALAGDHPAASPWVACSSRVLDRMHATEDALLKEALRSAATARAAARQALLRHAVTIAAVLLASAAVAALTARRLVRRLHRLRRAALKAQNELPSFVRRMARTRHPQHLAFDVTPVDLGHRDEVGDLTRAFDAVIKEAVEQTAQQAVLRAAVRAKLAAMSRRSHLLVHQQLDLLSQLQMAEQDPAVLGSLFRLDHLATRMRRHGETTLVLAGEDPGRRHREDAPLIDVLRAAASEVEDYTRAAVRPDVPGVYLKASAVHGITHMMAELIENATKFSPADRSVRLSAEATGTGGVVVRVSDDGSGIGPEQLDALNVRLQSELPVDWVQSECTGLYAVNCLAALHGASVYLDSTEQGTTVAVALPAALLAVAPTYPGQE
ncbi:nitrate- and nitrite sensing domain-containing protein [Streptomyces sp. NPDC002506]|uniref:sensor histidine kinase n=1 Tax=Streptomyces sp. NPDC002506 TaxID=3154536 RepID=UPI0033171944